MAPRVLLRADASAGMGTGHVMRCLAIAEEYLARGADCHFALAEAPAPLRRRLEQAGARLDALSPEAQDQALKLVLRDYRPELCFVDGYHFTAEQRALLKAGCGCCVVLDDFVLRAPFHAHVIVNSHPSARPQDYPELPPERLLLGSDYLPLRREFRSPPAGLPSERRRVFLNLGGSDPAGLSAPLADGLLKVLPQEVAIDLVIGAGNPRQDLLRHRAADWGARIDLHIDTPHMGRLMGRSGMAVTAAGSTLGELAAMAVPSLALVVADNQSPALRPPISDWAVSMDARNDPGVVQQCLSAAAGLWRDAAGRDEIARRLAALNLGSGCASIREALAAINP